MIGSNHKVENTQPIPLLGSYNHSSQHFLSLKNLKKVTLMTTVGNVLNLIGYMMTIRSWHKPHHKPLKPAFHPKKEPSKPLFSQ